MSQTVSGFAAALECTFIGDRQLVKSAFFITFFYPIVSRGFYYTGDHFETQFGVSSLNIFNVLIFTHFSTFSNI